MRPGVTLNFALWLLLAIALAAIAVRPFSAPAGEMLGAAWLALLSSAVLLAAIDLVWASRRGPVNCSRQISSILSLGRANTVTLTLHNSARARVSGRVIDHFPANMVSSNPPGQFALEADASQAWQYQVTPQERGEFHFGRAELELDSPLRMWRLNRRAASEEGGRVYPDFLALDSLHDASLEKSAQRLGIHLQRRRGEGTEFLQLREFREKDQLRQVDWKASARVHKLISREYHDQTDREIVFLLDCGRRMHGVDGNLSHFDHCLNAMLLCAYFALRLGDRVGVCTFAGEERWIRPVSHKHGIHHLLDQLYTLQTSPESTDFLEAAQTLASKRSKRALVIMITNVQTEDQADLDSALRVLGKRHAVMLANLKEDELVQQRNADIVNHSDALQYAVAEDLLLGRERVLELARRHNAWVVDSLPRHLHRALAEQYLLLKRSGSF